MDDDNGALEEQNGSQSELLRILASPVNQRLLCLVALEPTYPRKVGNLLAIPEREVARRLKRMEEVGLLESSWDHVGRNAKFYRLAAARLELDVRPQGIEFAIRGPGGVRKPSFVLLPFAFNVPQSEGFIGRAEELDALAGRDRVVIVEGMAGMGKTALLSRFLGAVPADRRVFWHSFRGLESLNWLAGRFSVFFAQNGDPNLMAAVEDGDDPANRRQILLRSLDDERYVIVFDDVHRIEDAAVRQFITDAIDSVRRARLIVSGREPPRFDSTLPGRRVLRLSGLRDEDVETFLSQKHVDVDAKLLPRLRQEVGGHPLALSLLLEAAAEGGVPIEKLLDRVPERNVEDYLLREVVTALPEDDRHVLTIASLFRDRFPAEALAAVAKRLPDYVLPRLRRRLLVQPVGTEYLLHEVVRNFFYTLVQDKAALHAKAAAHFAGLGTIEGRLEAMHHFLLAGRRDQVLELIEENLSLQDYDFIDAGYQNLYDDVLSRFHRDEVKDGRRWAIVLDERGDIKMVQGDPQAALAFYRDAATHAADAPGDFPAELKWKQALALHRLGRTDEARKVLAPVLGQPLGPGARQVQLLKLGQELGLVRAQDTRPKQVAATVRASRRAPKARARGKS